MHCHKVCLLFPIQMFQAHVAPVGSWFMVHGSWFLDASASEVRLSGADESFSAGM